MYNSQQNGQQYSIPHGAQTESDMLNRAAQEEYVFSVRDILQAFRKRLWLIVLVALVLSGVGVGFSLAQTPIYEASVKLLVGQQREERAPGDVPAANLWPPEQLTQTMIEGVKSRPVAEAAIQQLDSQITPDELLGHLDVQQVPKSQFIQVTYTDPSPERARQMANAIGDVFPNQIDQVNPSETNLFATAWERAETPSTPVSPKPIRNGLLALVLGLMLGAGLAFLLEYLDDRWRSPEEIEKAFGIPTFGVIPELEHTNGNRRR